MTVEPVPLRWLAYQPQLLRMSSRARVVPVWLVRVKWAWISKLEMKGDMLPGSSGASAPMGVQFYVSAVEMSWAVWEEGGMRSKRMAMLFASWGWRVVRVALSRKAP